MHRRPGIIAFLLLVVGLAGCGPQAGPRTTESAAPSAAPADRLPAGWRWESFGGVEVGVPGDWGWGTGNQRISQWCVGDPTAVKDPMVGRPGISTSAGCGGREGAVDPETLIKNTGWVVGFDRTDDRTSGTENEGDRTTVRLRGVQVVVQAPQALRRQIASTVRAVNDVDSHGCPIEHPVAAKPQWRPADPVDLASLTGVSAVSACRYSTDKDYWRGLISALRLSGAAAAAAVQGAAAAPIGGGPNTPQKCAPEVRYGDEIILLRVQSSAGLDEVVLRFDGCDHRGFDDGVRVRTLTATSVAPFVAGQNQVNDVSGSGMMGILRPEECPPPASSGQVVPSGDSSSPTGSTVC